MKEPLRDCEALDVEAPTASAAMPLMVEALANCVLPPEVGGQGLTACYITTEQRWLHASLVEVLQKRLSSAKPTSSSTPPTLSVEQALAACLGRLFVVRCHDQLELLAAANNLEPLVLQHDLRLVAVDSLNAYYWQERSGHAGGATVAATAAALARASEAHGLVVMGLRLGGGGGGEGHANATTVCREWTERVTRKIVVDAEGRVAVTVAAASS